MYLLLSPDDTALHLLDSNTSKRTEYQLCFQRNQNSGTNIPRSGFRMYANCIVIGTK